MRDLLLVLAGTGLGIAALLHWVALPWEVEGPSMEPALRSGDRVIVDLLTYARREPRPGEIALVLGPSDVPLVKRIVRHAATGPADPASFPASDPLEPTIWIIGDNAEESSDSRHFGPVPRRRVRGRVAWRYWPPTRMGPIE